VSYAVKETYYTLQGEGAQAGRAAVFLRFAGCNLWTGREEDRHKAVCKFCDTQFVGTDGVGGGKYSSAEALAAHVFSYWPADANGKPYVVCTGGEPALQLDSKAILALQAKGFEVAIESNGTLALPEQLDWVCISPKAGSQIVIQQGDELKLVFPQAESAAHPTNFEDWDFDNFYLQPLDGDHTAANTKMCIDYCLANPQWKLGVQMHKVVGIE
jgi:7-carboxy-7-deazaguanine synthase (Cx14CxxC type)